MIKKSNGVIYVAFGVNAAATTRKSVNSIKRLSPDLPIVTVGDIIVPNTTYIPWTGKSPRSNNGDLGFLSGKMKPFLYDLSPFKQTLYLDADTSVRKDIIPGFDYLQESDVCVSYHTRPTGESWYVDEIYGDPNLSPPLTRNSIKEREVTQKMIGNQRMPFINTGVIFFRTNDNVQRFFETWYKEWQIFGEWDEQMSFHRAICRIPELRVKLLPPIWNQKYLTDDTIIHHSMGKKKARQENNYGQ